jgi:sigma-B regulation protein RsbU (phosphoserine phosphatase)
MLPYTRVVAEENYMTVSDLEHFKNLILQRERNLAALIDSPRGINKADSAKLQLLIGQIKDAITRIENKTFGTCSDCKGEIELYRLEIQPVVDVCLGCISPKEQALLEEELTLAGKIHRALLPQTVEKINGFELAIKSLAARTIGGDYYDFIPAGDGKASRVIIADTMGKGLPAGLLMSNLQGALRVLAEEIDEPRLLLARLNRWLCRNVPMTKFVSMVCLAIEPTRDNHARIIYTNAGHCPPILVRSDNQIERLEPTGGVLGVHEGFTYSEASIEMESGDRLVLFTDGVTDAINQQDDMFGENRLLDFINKYRHPVIDLPDKLLRVLYDFSSTEELSDDLTIIALGKL